jgi:ribosomal protein L28
MMPCRDWDDNVRYVVQEVDRPQTVRILCEACRIIENSGNLSKMSSHLQRWWHAHKKEDAARITAEKAKLDKAAKKVAILSKLSEEEKKILGVS